MEQRPSRRLLLLLAALLAVIAVTLALYRINRRDEKRDAQPIWIVDAGVAYQYPQIPQAIASAGGRVLAFDFPGADQSSGRRYAWARDYGPLPMPTDDGGWVLWDAVSGGATPSLEYAALVELAALLQAPHRRLDLKVQGGNWLLLPDNRVITTTRFLKDNGDRSPSVVAAQLRSRGIESLIEIEPLPGESTRHADLVANVHFATGEVWPEALALIPSDADQEYRQLAEAAGDSLDRTFARLRAEIGENRVFRLPQPLPHVNEGAEPRYRFNFPSFVNGIFVESKSGETTYLFGLSRSASGESFYSYDEALVARYVAEVERLAADRGFRARGVELGGLITFGGSVRCATTEGVRYSRATAP